MCVISQLSFPCLEIRIFERLHEIAGAAANCFTGSMFYSAFLTFLVNSTLRHVSLCAEYVPDAFQDLLVNKLKL